MKRFLSISLVVLVVLAAALYLRPVPAAQGKSVPFHLAAPTAVPVPWPDYGQAAFGAEGYGVLATNGTQKAAPIASIAKIVTALSVLRQKPLQPGQQGPTLTMGSADVALYQKYVAENGSVVPVNDAENISEYQMLQAMLLPSGNNIADSLSNWAFGSQSAYLTYANNFVKGLGLTQTHLADASGFSPQSVSSAQDLVKLGEYALANPVLAGIVNQQQAVIPVAGIVHNVNWLLGVDGTDGIKTGNTDQAGGCFLFAAKQDIGDQQVQVVGAVLGAPDDTDPTQAIEDSQAIIEGSDVYFRLVQVSNANDKVGEYTTAWGASSTVVAKNALSLPVWNGSQAKINNNLIKISGATDAGAKVGTISITSSQRTAAVPVVLQQKIPGPSVFWRIFHI